MQLLENAPFQIADTLVGFIAVRLRGELIIMKNNQLPVVRNPNINLDPVGLRIDRGLNGPLCIPDAEPYALTGASSPEPRWPMINGTGEAWVYAALTSQCP